MTYQSPVGVGRAPGLWLTGALCLSLWGCGGSTAPPGVGGVSTGLVAKVDQAELVQRGRAALRSGDSVRAEHYFALAIANGYEERKLLPQILSACLLANRLRSALNYAQPQLRRQPKDPELRYLVATIHLGLGQVAAARTELQTLLVHHPEHADAHYLLGVLELERAPEEGEAHLRQYLALAKSGDKVSEAKEVLERRSLLSQDSSPKHFPEPQRLRDESDAPGAGSPWPTARGEASDP